MDTPIEITQDDLTEALTSFRLAVKVGRGQESREIADPETVASVLRATLGRIAAERAPDTCPDDLTTGLATLNDVRMQADDHHLVPAGMVYPLLAAIEAVLKLADELTGDAAPSSALEENRAWVRAACAAQFRERITRELTKGETGAEPQ